MLFYILFICIVLSLFFLSRVFPDGSRRYYFFELVGLFVIIFIGIFRFDVGWDYINYYNYIDKIEVNQIIRLEPLSQIFCIIAILFDNPPLLFVLFGLPTYLIFFHSFKKYSVNFQLSVLIFLAFFYLESFTSVRQILALSISISSFLSDSNGMCFSIFSKILQKASCKYSFNLSIFLPRQVKFISACNNAVMHKPVI